MTKENNPQITFQEYKELAEHLKAAEQILWKFHQIQPKKTRINTHYRQTKKAINQAKSSAEEMMWKEHPKKSKQLKENIFYYN